MTILLRLVAVILTAWLPVTQPEPSALSKFPSTDQKRIRDRAPDILRLPDGSLCDAYRLNRIRHLLTAPRKPDQPIDVKMTDQLGIGHPSHNPGGQLLTFAPLPLKPRHEWTGLPDLIAAPAGFWTSGAILCVNRSQGFEYKNDNRHIVLHEVKLVQLLRDREAIGSVPDDKGPLPATFHLRGDFKDLLTGKPIPGDFVLKPLGHYEDGGRRVLSFELQRFEPVDAEALAAAMLDGYSISTYTIRTKQGTTKLPPSHQWTAVPIRVPKGK